MKKSLTAVLIVLACNGPFGPDRGDPAQYVLTPPVVMGCRGWAPADPAEELGLFDITWNSSDQALKSRRWTNIRILTGNATAVHYFNVPEVVRVIMPVENVRSLNANIVHSVTDPSNLDVQVSVEYSRSVRNSDVAIFEELGGVVRHALNHIPFLFGRIPDSSIPALRLSAGVKAVRGNGLSVVCPASNLSIKDRAVGSATVRTSD